MSEHAARSLGGAASEQSGDFTAVAKRAKRRRRDHVASWMRSRGWNYKTPPNGLRHRLYDLTAMHHPWYDWGHRLMAVVGSDHGGTWDEFKPEPWFYRLGEPTRERFTGFPRHPMRRFEVIVGYSDFRKRTEGLNEDELYEWQCLYADEDGGLSLGHRFWGKPFYGTTYWELPLIRRYLRQWHRRDWYGLRSWLYRQGLHACVRPQERSWS